MPDTFALTRLSLGFSKKIEHHAYMVALYTVWYNFIKMHKTLRMTEGAHGVVTHSNRPYVVGAIHTNTIEGFWSLIKRGMVGTYHKVSRKYLPLYVAEFQFRYNNRNNDDIFGEAVRGC